mgnify:CR=1 FL=1
MTYDQPPLLIEPPALVHEVRKKKKRNRSDAPRRRQRKALYVGAIVMLTGDDGNPYACEVTHQTPDGEWWCIPTQ